MKRGLPLLPPAPKRAMRLYPRASPLPPTPSDFAYTGTIQTFHPQSDGYYTVTAAGASGGQGGNGGAGGLAARAVAKVYLTAGQSLSVVVGGTGSTGNFGSFHG